MSFRSMRGRAWLRGLLLVVVLALAAALAVGWNDYQRFSTGALKVSPQQQSIDVGRGTSFKGIVAELRRQGLTTASPW